MAQSLHGIIMFQIYLQLALLKFDLPLANAMYIKFLPTSLTSNITETLSCQLQKILFPQF